jgi:hypothetical protein
MGRPATSVGNVPLLDEASPDPEAKLAPFPHQRRQEIEEQPKMVGRDRRDVGVAPRHGVAAIEALAKGETRAADGQFGRAFQPRRAHDRPQNLQLREVDAEIAREQP